MGEKRKPDYVLLLRKEGNMKTDKVEMFVNYKFGYKSYSAHGNQGQKYRLRFNGKWFPEGERKFFTKTQIKEMVFKGIT